VRAGVREIALLVVVPFIALVPFAWTEDVKPAVRRRQPIVREGPVPGASWNRTYTAWTDQDTPIPVSDVAKHGTLPADLVAEALLVKSQRLATHLIRTAAPDRGSNCHGWVYTGGRYYVDANAVELILRDNGYKAVTTPRAGDLAIFRDQYGRLVHSSVVRVGAADGLVLVESKWSYLGCYLHTPKDYCYAASWTYYRSARAGHLLRGLDGTLSAP
jgi:hypothetical protein